jgi:hypothetical protein
MAIRVLPMILVHFPPVKFICAEIALCEVGHCYAIDRRVAISWPKNILRPPDWRIREVDDALDTESLWLLG